LAKAGFDSHDQSLSLELPEDLRLLFGRGGVDLFLLDDLGGVELFLLDDLGGVELFLLRGEEDFLLRGRGGVELRLRWRGGVELFLRDDRGGVELRLLERTGEDFFLRGRSGEELLESLLLDRLPRRRGGVEEEDRLLERELELLLCFLRIGDLLLCLPLLSLDLDLLCRDLRGDLDLNGDLERLLGDLERLLGDLERFLGNLERLVGVGDDLFLLLTGDLVLLRGGDLLGDADPEEDRRLLTGDRDFLLGDFEFFTGVLDLLPLLLGDLDPLRDDLGVGDFLEDDGDLRLFGLGLFFRPLTDGLLVGEDEFSFDFDGVLVLETDPDFLSFSDLSFDTAVDSSFDGGFVSSLSDLASDGKGISALITFGKIGPGLSDGLLFPASPVSKTSSTFFSPAFFIISVSFSPPCIEDSVVMTEGGGGGWLSTGRGGAITPSIGSCGTVSFSKASLDSCLDPGSSPFERLRSLSPSLPLLVILLVRDGESSAWVGESGL